MKPLYFFQFLTFLLVASYTIDSFGQCALQLYVDRDAQIGTNNPSNNNGSNPNIFAKRSSNGSNIPIQRGLFDFDWTCFPDSMPIDSARLFMFNALTTAGHNHQGSNTALLQQVTGSWSENVVSWNTQPSTTAVNQVTIPSVSPGDDLSIAITGLVQDILNQPQASRKGLLMRLQIEDNGTRRQTYASTDHSNSNLHPYLMLYATPIADISSTVSMDTVPLGGSFQVTFDICNPNTCCVLVNQSMQLNLPSGFTVVNSNVSSAGSSTGLLTGSALSITNLEPQECLTLTLTLSSNGASLGSHSICLQATAPLSVSGNGCSSFVLTDPQSLNLTAHAGADQVACVTSEALDTIQIGGFIAASGGVPPYNYEWQLFGDGSFIGSASTWMNDTTIPNPELTLDYLFGLDRTGVLKVTDAMGAIATDSVQIGACGYAPMPLGQAAYYHNLGDTIELSIWSGFTCIGDSMEWFPKDHIVSSPYEATIQVLISDVNFDYNSYNVEFYNEHGCVGTGGQDPLVAGIYPLGLTDISKSGLNLYPNPSTNEVNIISDVPMERIEVLDLNGRVMALYDNLGQASFMLNERLPAGVYVLKVTTATAEIQKRMIRQ